MSDRSFNVGAEFDDMLGRYSENGEFNIRSARPEAARIYQQKFEKLGGTYELLISKLSSLELDAHIRKVDKKTKDDGLFSYLNHVALGEGNRIRRCDMTLDHHIRRLKVINDSITSHQRAFNEEVEWLQAGMAKLKGRRPRTKRSSVLDENSNIIR